MALDAGVEEVLDGEVSFVGVASLGVVAWGVASIEEVRSPLELDDVGRAVRRRWEVVLVVVAACS